MSVKTLIAVVVGYLVTAFVAVYTLTLAHQHSVEVELTDEAEAEAEDGCPCEAEDEDEGDDYAGLKVNTFRFDDPAAAPPKGY